MTLRRIAYVLKIFPKVSETFIANELAELRLRGIEVRILSLLPPREELCHDVVRRYNLDRLTTYDSKEFSKVIGQFQPQLIHAHFATESTAAALDLGKEYNLPFTFTAHGYDIHRKPPPDFRERADVASAVVTVSEANAGYIEKTFHVCREKLRVIGCGVDTDYFCPGESAAGFEQEPLIVCVARHVKVKSLGLLLDACAELRKSRVQFRCVMIGDGPCRAELEEKRARLELDGIVEIRGAASQDEVLKFWQRSAIGVLTSDNEGMPVSLMEAAACGVPVVATAVGGVPELVSEGLTGLLVPAGDVAGFAAALERLLADSELRARMGVAARHRAQERFSIKLQMDKLLHLWSEVLERKARS
jgi:glycosyltransferase involved in cell wall biosynthesis